MGKIKGCDFWKKIRQSLISTVIEKSRYICNKSEKHKFKIGYIIHG